MSVDAVFREDVRWLSSRAVLVALESAVMAASVADRAHEEGFSELVTLLRGLEVRASRLHAEDALALVGLAYPRVN